MLACVEATGALSFNLPTGANNANLIYLDLVGAIASLGAGKGLWERLLALADGQRCHAVFLRSLPVAVDFWQRNGFKMWRGTCLIEQWELQDLGLKDWLQAAELCPDGQVGVVLTKP